MGKCTTAILAVVSVVVNHIWYSGCWFIFLSCRADKSGALQWRAIEVCGAATTAGTTASIYNHLKPGQVGILETE